MASIEQRGEAWRVYWRQGGRGGRKQSTTWDDEKQADRASELAKAHRHNISAAEVYRTILGLIDDNDPGPQTPTVREFADVWLKSRTRISDGTRATYRRQLDKVILPFRDDGLPASAPTFGDLHLREVTGTDVSTLLTALRTRFEDVTVTRYYSVVHALFAFAVKEKLIEDNPARRTDWIRDVVAHDDASDDGDDHVYLEPFEYRRLVECAKPGARPLIEFLAGTGCRISEATAVAIGAVDPLGNPGREEPPTVRVHRAWKHDGKGGWYLGTTKGRRRRTVEVGMAVVEAVAPLLVDRPRDALLFEAPAGGRVDYGNWLERRWEPAVVAAMRCERHPPAPRGRRVPTGEFVASRCGNNGGTREVDGLEVPCRRWVRRGWDRCHGHIDPPADAVSTCDCPTRLQRRPTPHDLRHSHVAWLLEDGCRIAEISQRLGHHSTEITERVYAGLLKQTRTRMAGAFDRVVRSAGSSARSVSAVVSPG